MSNFPATKRFLAALTRDGRASPRSQFLIPSLDHELTFVEIGTGKTHDHAYIVFVGREITVEDILVRMERRNSESARLITSLINELQRFRIGNVVALTENSGDGVKLRLVSNSPRPRPSPELPG